MDVPDYGKQLREFCKDYHGARDRAVKYAPEIFEFYALLFTRGHLNRENQGIVTSVLAYFVVAEDVYPENQLGPFGLVDDLYVASYAFRLLRNEIPSSDLIACWKGKGELEVVMNEIYRECRSEMGKTTKEALRLAGLS
ncbi:MAG: hypothetical protein VYA34_15995 [Myxococcota bacterium]|nr:hypothetical protein [Myxococcota bacterium]